MQNDVKFEKMFTVHREQPAGQIRGDVPARGQGVQADRHRQPRGEPGFLRRAAGCGRLALLGPAQSCREGRHECDGPGSTRRCRATEVFERVS